MSHFWYIKYAILYVKGFNNFLKRVKNYEKDKSNSKG